MASADSPMPSSPALMDGQRLERAVACSGLATLDRLDGLRANSIAISAATMQSNFGTLNTDQAQALSDRLAGIVAWWNGEQAWMATAAEVRSAPIRIQSAPASPEEVCVFAVWLSPIPLWQLLQKQKRDSKGFRLLFKIRPRLMPVHARRDSWAS